MRVSGRSCGSTAASTVGGASGVPVAVDAATATGSSVGLGIGCGGAAAAANPARAAAKHDAFRMVAMRGTVFTA